jgi:branched-chain amino acid transport system substrate-binding protein
MKKIMPLLFAVFVAGLFLGYGFAVSSRKEQKVINPPDPSKPIIFGVIAPFAGDAASYGESLQKVMVMAAEEINNSGGINGRTLRLIYENGNCTGKDAASAMQKLVAVDKVKIVIGGFCSAESLAAAPIAEENHILLFSPSSSSPLLSNAGPYFFRNFPSDNTQGKVLANAAYNNGWRKMAVIQEQTDYAVGITKAFSENFSRMGGETQVESFTTDTRDFRTILVKLKVENPDALLISASDPPSITTILKQLPELDWKPRLLGADIIAGFDIVKTNPELVEGMLVAEFGVDRSLPKFNAFLEKYKARYQGEEPGFLSYAQTEYDAVQILNDAVLAVGEEPDAIRLWLHTVKDWAGASGTVVFEKDNGDRVSGHRLEVIENGVVAPVEDN